MFNREYYINWDFMDLILLNFFDDFDFVIKIFFVLTIIAFVKQKVTHNTTSLVLISIAVIGMVFLWWPFFKLTYIVYVVLSIGATTVLVDMFFVSMGHGGEEAMELKDQMHHSEGTEHQMHMAHKSHGSHKPHNPLMFGGH